VAQVKQQIGAQPAADRHDADAPPTLQRIGHRWVRSGHGASTAGVPLVQHPWMRCGTLAPTPHAQGNG
jgi:hypothetical protein